MAVKISEMDPLVGSIAKNDMFEMCQKETMKSVSVTAKQIADFNKSQNNSGFCGQWTDSFDKMTFANTGVWWYNGDSPFSGAPGMGMIELYTYASVADGVDSFIQRFNTLIGVYQRVNIKGSWSDWTSLSNRNDCNIVYGQDDTNEVTFPNSKLFKSTPTIICTPVLNDTQNVQIVKLVKVTTTGFEVKRYQSSLSNVVTTVTEKVNEDTSTTKTTTTTTQETRGAWAEVSSGCPFNWVAILEYAN